MNQNPIEMEVVPKIYESSEKEMMERGLRILARIIARRHIENIHSKELLEREGDALTPYLTHRENNRRVW
jgi:hypothetical protein